MLASYGVGGLLPGEQYKTLALFYVYFVLKMFKNIDFCIKTRQYLQNTLSPIHARYSISVLFFQSMNVI